MQLPQFNHIGGAAENGEHVESKVIRSLNHWKPPITFASSGQGAHGGRRDKRMPNARTAPLPAPRCGASSSRGGAHQALSEVLRRAVGLLAKPSQKALTSATRQRVILGCWMAGLGASPLATLASHQDTPIPPAAALVRASMRATSARSFGTSGGRDREELD